MFRVRALAFTLLIVLVAAAVTRLFASDKDKYAFSSGWRTRAIQVDGNDEEWRPILQPVAGQHFSVAFLNDEDSLYFCLVTVDANAIRQISTMGLTLWLDPAGTARKETFGVRYRGASGPRIDVLGPGSKDARQIDNGSGGFAARMDGRPDLLVYELKVPLRKTEATPVAPDVDAGAAMRATLETPEWRGPLPPVGRGGRVQVGVGVAGPNGGIFYPGPDTTLLRRIQVTGALRLASAPQAPAR